MTVAVPKSVTLPQNLMLHKILYLNQKLREREITSGGALQVMPTVGFQGRAQGVA
jgi:hypothetical protein